MTIGDGTGRAGRRDHSSLVIQWLTGAVLHQSGADFESDAPGRYPAAEDKQLVAESGDTDSLSLVKVVQPGARACGGAHDRAKSGVVIFHSRNRLKFRFRIPGTKRHDPDPVLA